MVDVVLIVTSVIFAMLILMASVYFVVYFQHPDDTNVAIFPKIITVNLSIRLSVPRRALSARRDFLPSPSLISLHSLLK